jgi:hypothetical protein
VSSNVALDRLRRAHERRQAVRQERRLEVIESELGVKARLAAREPIRLCLLQGVVDGRTLRGGTATILMARGASAEALTAAEFAVDALSLGVKEVSLEEISLEALAERAFEMSATASAARVEPAYARKLLREAAAWAGRFGVGAHADFAAVEQIFGDVDASACVAAFSFGHNGKPVEPQPA